MADAVSSKVIDFSNVKDRGQFNPKQIPAGDYLAKVVKVEDAVSSKDQEFQYLFTIKVEKFSQHSYPFYCKLSENQLWKLRNLLIAAGMNVPKKRMSLNPSKIVGKLIGVTMEDDEYEGKMKSVIAAVFPASELSDEVPLPSDDDDDADDSTDDDPWNTGGDTDDSADEPDTDEVKDEEAEEEAADEADEFDGMDRNALKRYIKEAQPDAKFRTSQTDDDLRDIARELAGNGEEEADEDLDELDIEDL